MGWSQGLGDPAAPWWAVVVIGVAGAVVGALLAPRLVGLGYRLDEEHDRRAPRWAAGGRVVVPVVTAALWALLAWRVGGTAEWTLLPALLTFTTVSVALTWMDADVHRLPTGLLTPATALVAAQLVLSAVVTRDAGPLVRGVVAGVALAGVLLALALAASVVGSAFGLGDVRLGLLLGLVTGHVSAWCPVVAVYAAFGLGGLWALGRLLTRRAGRRTAIAFGPWLLAGAHVALLVEVPPLF
jgi:leader peptidase (prepilin peptidase)/N-methyltransferase